MEFEEQKRGLMFAMTNTLRTSRLVDMINVQEAAAAFGMLLNQQKAGAPIDVTPFYEWLVEQKKVPADAVAELLLFFKSRESRYQTTIKLPAALESASEAEKARIVSQFVQRGATSGTYAAFNAGELKDLREAAKRPPSVSGPAPVAPPPARAAKRGAGRPRALLGGLAVVAALGAGATIWVNQTAPPKAAALVVTDAGALPCAELTANDGYALCRLRSADAARLSAADLKKAAEITKAAVQRQGATRGLHVFTLEENRHVGTW